MNEDEYENLRKAVAGMAEGFANMRKVGIGAHVRRDGEGSYLALNTAYECALVEDRIRERLALVSAGRLRWKETAQRYSRQVIETHGALVAAEGDRDEYKARWEKRGRELTIMRPPVDHKAWESARKAEGDRDECLRSLEATTKSLNAVSAERNELVMDLERAVADRDAARVGAWAAEKNLATSRRRECAHGHDFLSVARENTHIHDVVRISDSARVGVIKAHGDGFNAYQVRDQRDYRFIGWYPKHPGALRAVIEVADGKQPAAADKGAVGIDGVRIGDPGPPPTGDTVMVATGRKGAWDVVIDSGVIGCVVDETWDDVSYTAYTATGRTIGRFTYANDAMAAVRRNWGSRS